MGYNIFADYNQAITKQPVLQSHFVIAPVTYNIKVNNPAG